MLWPRRPRETEPESAQQPGSWAVLSALRKALPGVQAFFLLGASGELLEGAAVDTTLDVAAVASEYATLVRIVERTSRDAGMGDLQEQILISSATLTLVLQLPNDSVAVFVCSPGESIGRLRYELKRSLLYSSLSNL
jgi:predicted regulator of Ras-like GTPase activity (Roadblock/LC7/MglB family)